MDDHNLFMYGHVFGSKTTANLVFFLVYCRIMASSLDTQRLREEFVRAAGDIDSDDEARIASPGVEGMVKFLGSITEGEVFGIEQIRHAFQAKEWAEGVDVTWPKLEALVDTLIQDAPRVENISIAEKESSTANHLNGGSNPWSDRIGELENKNSIVDEMQCVSVFEIAGVIVPVQ